jgi:hypothetical protein
LEGAHSTQGLAGLSQAEKIAFTFHLKDVHLVRHANQEVGKKANGSLSFAPKK